MRRRQQQVEEHNVMSVFMGDVNRNRNTSRNRRLSSFLLVLPSALSLTRHMAYGFSAVDGIPFKRILNNPDVPSAVFSPSNTWSRRSRGTRRLASRYIVQYGGGSNANENSIDEKVDSTGWEGSGKSALRNIAACSLASMIFCSSTFATPTFAFDNDDYASETVQNAVNNLRSSVGNTEKTFEALKDIADIITEGKGVGGSIDYEGVKLERGLVADEDTAIYNPGLTLLTQSEKERLVDAVIENRRGNFEKETWSMDNELGYDFLKTKLDPWHIYELGGYLNILPIWGAIVYLATLFVQQNNRSAFPLAYIGGALAVFGPIFVLIALGT